MKIERITVTMENGESIRLNHQEVLWFRRDGGLVGYVLLEQFRDFCHEKLSELNRDKSIENGMDAERMLKTSE